MRILKLQAENIKCLKAVEIKPGDNDVVLITGANGQGKQQPISEPVLTPDGWCPIGKLKINDYVIGSNGQPTRIMGVYPQAERKTFLITMYDGGSIRCGPEHLWTVNSWKGRRRVTETLSTIELIKRGVKVNASHRRWSVPIVDAVEFADQGIEVPIDPYTLGVILGDGHIEPTGYVTVTSYDEEIFKSLGVDGWRNAHNLGTGFWSRPLKHLELAGLRAHEKFIPAVYLRTSIKNRKALLAGLLDTDGTAPDSWAEFTTTSEQLADDVLNLGLSLGYVCKKGKGRTKKYRYKNELKEGRMAWNIAIKSTKSPFLLSRKSEKWSVAKQRPVPRRYIDSIVEVTPEDSVCIRVEANDGLYVSKDYILTHNSSVLDSIWLALETRTATKDNPKPVRQGANSGKVTLDLGDYIVHRTIKPDGKSTLRVETPVGDTIRSPQALLDGFLSHLSFDPLEFARYSPKEQYQILAEIVGLDLDTLDIERKEFYTERTEVGRHKKTLEGQLRGITEPTPSESTVEESGTELLEQIRKEQEFQAASKEAAETFAKIEELKKQIKGLQTLKKKIEKEWKDYEPVDIGELKTRYRSIEDRNKRVREIHQYNQVKRDHDDVEHNYQLLNDKIEMIDIQKLEAIENAALPVDGLTVDEKSGVCVNQIPFIQLSQAEQIKISMTIAMHLNPEIRVIRIRDGSLLDTQSTAIIHKMAQERDYQIWMECVDETGQVGVYIEEGEVSHDEYKMDKNSPTTRKLKTTKN